MSNPLTPQTLAWLRQSAALDHSAYSQALLHLLERVESLEQRPIPGTVELATPNPEAAPVATDEELCSAYDNAPEHNFGPAIRAVYNLGRQHGAAQLPAAPPAPPVEPLTVDARDPECVERWPDCHREGYDSRCCRFPKSCSCGGEPPTPQPAPVAAPAGGLVERVACKLAKEMSERRVGPGTEWTPIALAAILEVAAWLRETGNYGFADDLQQEVDR